MEFIIVFHILKLKWLKCNELSFKLDGIKLCPHCYKKSAFKTLIKLSISCVLLQIIIQGDLLSVVKERRLKTFAFKTLPSTIKK